MKDQEANWTAIDDVLTPADRQQRREQCQLLAIEPGSWWRVSSLARWYTAVAVQRLAHKLGLSNWDAAVLEAAERLGINGESHGRKLRSWIKEAGRTAAAVPPVGTSAEETSGGNLLAPGAPRLVS